MIYMMIQITIITLCITFLFAGLASAKMWQDDFEDGELGENWTPAVWVPQGIGPPNWKVEDGILKGHWPNWSAQMLFLEEYPSLDYTIQVKCRIDRLWLDPWSADAGFCFRSSGPGVGPNDNITFFYGFGIGVERAQFAVSHGGGGWHYAGTTPENHTIGQWYTLKLVVKGHKFIGYVNDKPVCKIGDDKLKGKFVGLGMGANIDASFDDFMISDKVDDTAFDEMDVSPTGLASTKWASLKTR